MSRGETGVGTSWLTPFEVGNRWVSMAVLGWKWMRISLADEEKTPGQPGIEKPIYVSTETTKKKTPMGWEGPSGPL